MPGRAHRAWSTEERAVQVASAKLKPVRPTFQIRCIHIAATTIQLYNNYTQRQTDRHTDRETNGQSNLAQPGQQRQTDTNRFTCGCFWHSFTYQLEGEGVAGEGGRSERESAARIRLWHCTTLLTEMVFFDKSAGLLFLPFHFLPAPFRLSFSVFLYRFGFRLTSFCICYFFFFTVSVSFLLVSVSIFNFC